MKTGDPETLIFFSHFWLYFHPICCPWLLSVLLEEQRMWFLGMESTPGEDAEKTVEITRKDLEY